MEGAGTERAGFCFQTTRCQLQLSICLLASSPAVLHCVRGMRPDASADLRRKAGDLSIRRAQKSKVPPLRQRPRKPELTGHCLESRGISEISRRPQQEPHPPGQDPPRSLSVLLPSSLPGDRGLAMGGRGTYEDPMSEFNRKLASRECPVPERSLRGRRRGGGGEKEKSQR